MRVATQWQLLRWRFMRHRLALIAAVVLGLLYFSALFAGVIAPYDPLQRHVHFKYAPPQRLHFWDDNGHFHWRPFVYALRGTRDIESGRRHYIEDKSRKYHLQFWVDGEPYKYFFRQFTGHKHLIGVDQGGTLFILGTDKLGKDVLSRSIHGSRLSLSIGLVGVAITFVLGIVFGGISGYCGGAIDVIIQRFIECLRSIPTLPLWMGISAALPLHWSTVQVYFAIVIILSLVGWTDLARVVRGKFMSLKEEDFVVAASLNGAGRTRIIFSHLLPSFFSHIIASLTLSIPGMILAETALSFIGLGLRSPALSWGVLLKEAQFVGVLAHHPWLLTPGIFVIIAVLAFNFVGDGLRDATDPYGSR